MRYILRSARNDGKTGRGFVGFSETTARPIFAYENEPRAFGGFRSYPSWKAAHAAKLKIKAIENAIDTLYPTGRKAPFIRISPDPLFF